MKKSFFQTNKILTVFLVFILCFGVLFGAVGCGQSDETDGLSDRIGEKRIFTEVSKVQFLQKDYSFIELQNIALSSFISLNTIDYDSISAERRAVTDAYITAVNAFSDRLFSACLAQNNIEDNFSFSPIGVYEILHLLQLAGNSESVLSALTDVLGMNCNQAKGDFINAYLNDVFSNDDGTLQRYNGAFFTTENTVDATYLREIADRYVDAFQMDFSDADAVGQMVDWVNTRLHEEGFLKAQDLDLTDETAFVFFSTLFFDNRWATRFLTGETQQGIFYGATEQTASYMRHSYHGSVYDYGEYVSCYDYYANGMSVKYFTPKSKDADIWTLLNGKSLFFDDEEKLVNTDDHSLIVDLSVPKFSSESTYNFNAALDTMGLTELYLSAYHPLDKMFSDLLPDESIYLSFIKSKSKVSFSEDGTIIKSYVEAMGEKSNSIGPQRVDTYVIHLDSPFVYVIYDRSGLPLFVGNVNTVL